MMGSLERKPETPSWIQNQNQKSKNQKSKNQKSKNLKRKIKKEKEKTWIPDRGLKEKIPVLAAGSLSGFPSLRGVSWNDNDDKNLEKCKSCESGELLSGEIIFVSKK